MKTVSTALTSLGFIVVSGLSIVSAQAPACSDSVKSHQFDFWIGDWEVTAGGNVVGRNVIEPILDGCVLQENWTGTSGSAGSSFNYYNPQTGEWEQFWVWRRGTTIHTKGGYADGKMVLEGETTDQNGDPSLNRITFFNNEDGTVRQYWQVSSDGGETWTDAFDGLYTKR